MTINPSVRASMQAVLRSAATLLLVLGITQAQPSFAAATTLADQPLFTYNSVPGNLLLSLSVEFPTAISVANSGAYVNTSAYVGYFDALKCYTYQYSSTVDLNTYFVPVGYANASSHTCTSTTGSLQWSGNFLNWAAMQTIDPFRFALTAPPV